MTGDGRMFISSEGAADDEARLAPAIIEYSTNGEFIRHLPVRRRYSPNANRTE